MLYLFPSSIVPAFGLPHVRAVSRSFHWNSDLALAMAAYGTARCRRDTIDVMYCPAGLMVFHSRAQVTVYLDEYANMLA